MAPQPPTQIYSPRLDSITSDTDRYRGTTIEMLVTSRMNGVQYRIAITNPVFLVEGTPAASEDEIRRCFAGCELVSVFEDRAGVEFTSRASFRGVKGDSIELVLRKAQPVAKK